LNIGDAGDALNSLVELNIQLFGPVILCCGLRSLIAGVVKSSLPSAWLISEVKIILGLKYLSKRKS
jgi:hypothetical protein